MNDDKGRRRFRIEDAPLGKVLEFRGVDMAGLSVEPFVTIGEAASRVLASTKEKMMIDASGDSTAEAPRFWRMLRAAALDAKARGATISIIPQGFFVRKAHVMEIVTFEQADVGVLERALDRVAPYPETAGE